MWLIDQLAEQKISEAIANGELDNLPGDGQPITLDDDRLVPEEFRAGYRLLKNAGFLPPDAQIRKDIASVESLLVQASSHEERGTLNKRLGYLLVRLSLLSPQSAILTETFYTRKLKDQDQ